MNAHHQQQQEKEERRRTKKTQFFSASRGKSVGRSCTQRKRRRTRTRKQVDWTTLLL